MPRAKNGDVEIEWQSFGDSQPQAILLVNGLGSQMTRWPEAFCEKLVARGYRAIRLDNRDTGLSTWPQDKYTLTDMANDAVAVLDAAGVQKAHIAGVSMGGMVVQRMALDHPDRVLSMTSIMSTTGEPSTPSSRRPRPWPCSTSRRRTRKPTSRPSWPICCATCAPSAAPLIRGRTMRSATE